VFLEAGHEGVNKLFGSGIIGLRILHAAAELLHSGVDQLLAEVFRASDIHQLANAGFFLRIDRARSLRSALGGRLRRGFGRFLLSIYLERW
jgi:hypothetical protein